ncbi:hypothetical protein AOLI_G00313190 [Acnodon oligacanthus]
MPRRMEKKPTEKGFERTWNKWGTQMLESLGRSQDHQRQAIPPPDSELPSSAQPQVHPIPPPPRSISSSPPPYAPPTLYDAARALMEQAAGEVAALTEEPSLKVTTPPSLTPVGSSSNPFLGPQAPEHAYYLRPRHEQNAAPPPQMPMVEVAGPEGIVLVSRYWTEAELTEAA